jgi:hypothetical protein
MVGRREVEGLVLNRLKIFFLVSPLPLRRLAALPKPESIRAGVIDIVLAIINTVKDGEIGV